MTLSTTFSAQRATRALRLSHGQSVMTMRDEKPKAGRRIPSGGTPWMARRCKPNTSQTPVRLSLRSGLSDERPARAVASRQPAEEGITEARRLIQQLLDEAEPEAHKNAPQGDAAWGSRTGGILDCPWCAAREFVAARPPVSENEKGSSPIP